MKICIFDIMIHCCKFKRTVALLAFLCISICCISQSNNLDSLKKLIEPNKIESTKKIDILATIANEYRNINNDTGIIYANKAIKEATIIKYDAGLSNAYRSKGNNLYYQN